HGENIADPQERARDVPRKGAERSLDVAVDPAARRYAAPALRTADPDRADADCAGDECQGCVGSKGSGERARYRENSGADHHAYGAGRQAQRPDCADKTGVALIPHLSSRYHLFRPGIGVSDSWTGRTPDTRSICWSKTPFCSVPESDALRQIRGSARAGSEFARNRLAAVAAGKAV